MIKKLALGAKILIVLTGAFFILMGLDVFTTVEDSFWMLVAGFFIGTLPGIIMVAVTIIFWKKEFILSMIVFGIVIFWTVFLIFRGNFPEMIGGLLIVDIPLVIAGTILLVDSKKVAE